MEIPLQITVHETHASPAVEAEIREKAAKLERFAQDIMRCHVIVEAPRHHQRKGKIYNIRIDLRLPGDEIAVNHQSDKDVFVSIRDAFDAAVRQLEDYQRRRRLDVKHHEEVPEGEVASIFPDGGYGFIRSPGGDEVYFHENALQGLNLRGLRVGTKVHYVEEMGEKGRQAVLVKPFGRMSE